MSKEPRPINDLRSGQDRRQNEDGPTAGYERRHTVEPRQPELTELHLSEDELRELGFLPATVTPQKPG